MNLPNVKNKTKYLSLFLLFAVVFLLIPHQAHALIAGDIVAIFSAMGEGLKNVGGPLMDWIFSFLIWYILAFLSLYLSATLLTFVVSHPEWLNLANSPVANSGWNFTAGVANVFLVLVLLVIAFTYILRIETFEAKKALPRLIIIALLINFSFVFVKVMVDISTFLYNTVLNAAGITAGGETTLVYDVINTLGFNLNRVIEGFIILLAGFAIKSLIPFLSPFFQLALILGVITLVFLPNVVLYYTQIALSFLLASVFLIFTILFVMRIFMIQILAALAPLAFVCFVLPQTKKHWNEWLDHLLGWSFLGVFLFFFLVLGLKAGVGLQPTTPLLVPTIAAPFFGMGGELREYFIYYLFLIVYLALILWLSKRAMPAIAGFILAEAAAIGATVYTTGLKPMGAAFQKQTDRAAVAQKKTEDDAAEAGRPLKTNEKIGSFLAKNVRRGYQLYGTSPEARLQKDLEKEAGKIEATHGNNIESAISVYGKSNDDAQLAALGKYATKTGKVDKLPPELQKRVASSMALLCSDKDVKDFVKYNPDFIEDADIGEKIQRKVVSKGTQDKDVQELMAAGQTKAEAIVAITYKKVAQALKNENIPDISDASWENNKFKEAIVKYQSAGFIRKVGEEKGSEYIEKLHDAADEIGAKELAKVNPTLLRQSITNPGFKAVFAPVVIKKGADKKLTDIADLNDIIEESKGKEVLRKEGVARPSVITEEEGEVLGREGITEEKKRAEKEAKEITEELRKRMPPGRGGVGGEEPEEPGEEGRPPGRYM